MSYLKVTKDVTNLTLLSHSMQATISTLQHRLNCLQRKCTSQSDSVALKNIKSSNLGLGAEAASTASLVLLFP